MNNRGRPRKVQEENPGASAAPRATGQKNTSRNEEQEEDKNSHLKLKKTQQVRPKESPRNAKSTEETQAPKTVKSGERKVASRSSAMKDTSVEEKGAPKKSTKTTDTKVSSPSNQQESQDTRPKKSPRDANAPEETRAPKTGKNGEKKAAPTRSRRCSSIDDSPTKVLQAALEKLKVKKKQRSESAKFVNNIQNTITDYVKRHLDWCKNISVLTTGSYYENVKICEPDEFDVMLTVRVERVTLVPFTEDGAFYSVEMKRHPKHYLEKFFNEDSTIKASEMLSEFREKVKDALSTLQYVTVEKKKVGCPAVTVKENNKDISIDFVLGLEVHSSWPSFTQDGFNIENWLSKKEKMVQRRKPFYLVPKYEGRGNTEQGGIKAKDAWRISFSHVEKHILKNHGNSKTCCEGEQKCCRKPCLKLLKYLLQRLKETHPKETDKLCSYHAKTILLHACATRVNDSEWADSELSHCFEQLLMDFEQYLRNGQLPNFFIPSQNLFNGMSRKKCSLIADYVESQRNNGFPLLC